MDLLLEKHHASRLIMLLINFLMEEIVQLTTVIIKAEKQIDAYAYIFELLKKYKPQEYVTVRMQLVVQLQDHT